jgi:hypothetical protein
MSVTLSLTESQTLTALRSFLISILPAGTEVVKAQDNRVPEPRGENFVTMTPILRDRLETNVHTYSDGYPSAPSTKSILEPTKVTVQLDVHGPASADNAQVISTLFRDEYAVTAFAATGFDVTPLYADDPKQVPFVNGEQQVEERWIVEAVMQCNPSITVPQDFAASVPTISFGNPLQ